jgi:hypothetical protein
MTGVERVIQTAVTVLILMLSASRTVAQIRQVPKLGSEVPDYVLAARAHSQQCLTDTGHRDPCASVNIEKTGFTIAWDVKTLKITYLFTSDPGLMMDGELSVGGTCSLVEPAVTSNKLFLYMSWLITPAWADLAKDVSGDAHWYAALRRDAINSGHGTIVGFVQSRYLNVGQ